MFKNYISSKVHNIVVTDKSIDYQGSVSIDSELLKAANIDLYQQVDIINLSNANRWQTYAIAAGQGVFTLNGGGARLGEIGDRCVILAYSLQESFVQAKIIYCDQQNQIIKSFNYAKNS